MKKERGGQLEMIPLMLALHNFQAKTVSTIVIRLKSATGELWLISPHNQHRRCSHLLQLHQPVNRMSLNWISSFYVNLLDFKLKAFE